MTAQSPTKAFSIKSSLVASQYQRSYRQSSSVQINIFFSLSHQFSSLTSLNLAIFLKPYDRLRRATNVW